MGGVHLCLGLDVGVVDCVVADDVLHDVHEFGVFLQRLIRGWDLGGGADCERWDGRRGGEVGEDVCFRWDVGLFVDILSMRLAELNGTR